MLKRDFSELEFSELIKLVESLDQKDIYKDQLRIAFLRNVTLDTIVPYLRFLCYKENFKPIIHMGEYDNALQFVMDKDSFIHQIAFDVIIICLKLETLSKRLVTEFSSMNPSEITEEAGRIVGFIDKIISEIRKDIHTPVLIHNFETPVYPSFGILDYQDHHSQVNTIRSINRNLVDIITKYESIFIVDVDLLQSTIGYLNYNDNRFWLIGKAPYSRQACQIIAGEYIKFINALKGKNKKCLVLDCDNILWGGIIGEDGINKIKLSKIYPGSAYYEFQQAIINLYNRGIALAICSKNNESDVLEVMRNHPDMILKEEHFVSMKINWKDKVTNLKEIANELNIGLDSLVFIDDSDFEINLVRQMLPEVKAIKLSQDASLYKDILNSSGIFDTLVLSKEDRERNETYKAEIKRKRLKNEFLVDKIEDYYRYLEMEVSIEYADDFLIPRISQLTQRTNQFNLTTGRYSESEIKEISESKDADVFCLSLKDRFGDSGIVGVAILKYSAKDAFIDTFLLSCRVIGRGVEGVLLNVCINTAIQRNCERIIGLYKPTQKNGQVEGFYSGHNFSVIEKNESATQYSLILKKTYNNYPDYFKSIRVNNKKMAVSIMDGDNGKIKKSNG